MTGPHPRRASPIMDPHPLWTSVLAADESTGIDLSRPPSPEQSNARMVRVATAARSA